LPITLPTINGQKVDQNFDLDNEADLTKLGLDPKDKGKISDRYVHYSSCKHAVIEGKGTTVHKAIEQIERTMNRLLNKGHKVDFAIIIMKRLNHSEQRKFKRGRDRVLFNPQTREPYTVNVGNQKRDVLLLYTSEANLRCERMDKYLSHKEDS
jgi:hypothetical protein